MTLPTFQAIPVPQDMQIVLADGRVNPVWHRFFIQLPQLIPLLTALSDALGSESESRAAVASRVSAIADAAGATLTIGASYTQAEIQALEARLRDQAATINQILAALRSARILEA